MRQLPLLATCTYPRIDDGQAAGIQPDHSFGGQLAERHLQPGPMASEINYAVEFEVEQLADPHTGGAKQEQPGPSEGVLERLCGLGYQFSVFTPVGPELRRAAGELQLPISVQAWFDEVGEVDFSGRHPQLCHFHKDAEYRGVDADPLMFFLEPSLVMDDGLVTSLAPAEKSAQASGEQVDDFLSIPLPSRGADAVLEGDAGSRTFVEYLRRSFEWGGFPGWEGAPDPLRDLLRSLTEGLEPM